MKQGTVSCSKGAINDKVNVPVKLMLIAIACVAANSALVAQLQARGLPLSRSLEGAGYARVGSQRGVTVYRNKRSPITVIAAEATLPASPQQIQRALINYAKHPGHVAHLAQSQVLSRASQQLFVYQRLDLPLISDRDYVLKVRWGTDTDGVRWVDFNAVPKHVPHRSGVVRISHHTGSWELQPVGGGSRRAGATTRARYQLSIDLAGSLPKWLARSGASKKVPALFEGICRIALANNRAERCKRFPIASR